MTVVCFCLPVPNHTIELFYWNPRAELLIYGPQSGTRSSYITTATIVACNKNALASLNANEEIRTAGLLG